MSSLAIVAIVLFFVAVGVIGLYMQEIEREKTREPVHDEVDRLWQAHHELQNEIENLKKRIERLEKT